MFIILSFLFVFAALYLYADSSDTNTILSKKESALEQPEKEIDLMSSILNFKAFIIPDELNFLKETDNILK